MLEGSPAILEKAKRGWNVGSVYGAINAIWLNYNVPVLYTPSKHYTAILLANLCRRLKGGGAVTVPKMVKVEDFRDAAMAMLSQIPLVNTVKAQRILEKFGSVKGVAENLEKIDEIEGIGEKISEAVKKAFTTKLLMEMNMT